MLPALATLADLEHRLGLDEGTLDGADEIRAQAALDDASALVRDEARQTWVNESNALAGVPDVIFRVTLGAALRNYVNPDGLLTEQVGPFSRTIKQTEAGVYLTEAEVVIVRRFRPTGGGLWTQKLYRDDLGDQTLYLEDSFGCELFPVGSTYDPLA